ncbi:energy transducer TonB [Pseudomonas sp. SAR267]|jgi:protein TonB|uniref:energy transducer TonB n=1 Tax=Pseudomonas TaxID=286 RepID=UPI000C17EBD2|nr:MULTISPECIES: energy transducer TonB [unclassified Pseudomonas]AXQ46350.1 energy transducer TonB [Stenotrophomonas rhizophila]MBS3188010.1 energy transducer TonB [Pseudomonas sp. PCH44]PIK78615.1 energy transducer TonB [Pseudomonas sp. 382]
MGNVQSAVRAYDQPWRPSPGDLVDLGRTLRLPLGQLRLQRTPVSGLKRRDKLALGLLVLALHGAAAYWVSQAPTPALPVVPPQIPPMTIEFAAPAPPVVQPPPPAPAPPVVEPPPPVIDELAAKPKPKPKPVAKPVAKQPPKPQPKPVEAPPPAPVAAPAPPAPPAPAPVTPPSANAAYLKNPAPEYPQMALRRGWEGTVLLRVEVLPSGKPGQIQIQQSSGRDALDAAALAAVKRWSFVPAKQGDVAQAGWVSVPIDFKLR